MSLVQCPNCSYLMNAAQIRDGLVHGDPDEDGSQVVVHGGWNDSTGGVKIDPDYVDPRVGADPDGTDHQGLGQWGAAPHQATPSGVGQGLQQSASNAGRQPWMRDFNGNIIPGSIDGDTYQFAEADLNGARADYDDVVDLLRVRRYEICHVMSAEGEVVERTPSKAGAKELLKLEKAAKRAEVRYFATRNRQNAIEDERTRAENPATHPDVRTRCLFDEGGACNCYEDGPHAQPRTR